MLEYNYDKEILENLQDYIKRIEVEANTHNKIMDLFYCDKRLYPIYNKKSTELSSQGVEETSIIVKVTIDYLLDRINELEKSYSDIKDKTINPAHVIVPIVLSENDIRILNILHQKYHHNIYLYALCSSIGISEEYVNKFLTKMEKLGYYSYLRTIHNGYLTSEGIKLVEEINNERKKFIR